MLAQLLALFLVLKVSALEPPMNKENPEVFRVKGRILEKGTRKPIANQRIFILPHKLKAETNEVGEFEFVSVPKGEIQVVVNVAGYLRFDKKDQVTFDRLNYDLYIEKQNYDFFETTVVAKKKKRDTTQRKLSPDEFLTVPGAAGDPIKAVQNLPGINRSSGGNSQVVIQGAEPEDTKYVIEGHSIPLIFHFGGLSSIVTPEAVESVEYLSAGYGTEYSSALGGVVGLSTRSPKTDRVHSMAFMDNFNIGGLVEGPLGKNSSGLLAARYAYIGPILATVFEDNEDFNLTVAPTFWDITGVYENQLSDTHKIKTTMISSKDTLEFVLSAPIDDNPELRGDFFQQTSFWRLIQAHEWNLSPTSTVRNSIGLGQNRVEFQFSDNFFKIESNIMTTRGEWEKQINERWTSILGYDNSYNWYEIGLRLPTVSGDGDVSDPIGAGETVSISQDGKLIEIGTFWRNELILGEAKKWTLIPGLRHDYFRLTKDSVLQPRMAVTYAYDKTLLLKVASGLYYQPPGPDEAASNNGGNTDLLSPNARHLRAGFDLDLRGGSNLGWEVFSGLFYKDLQDLVIASDDLIVRNSVLALEYYNNDGTGNITGAELELRYAAEKWFTGVSYTYTRSRRSEPDNGEHPSEFDQTHSLNWIYRYDLSRWRIGTRLRYVTGNPITPVLGSVYDSESDVYLPIRGGIFSDRQSDFFQLDVRVDRKWVMNTWILYFYVDIQNLTNQQNQEGLNYSFDYSEEQKITGLPLLPSIGVKGEF